MVRPPFGMPSDMTWQSLVPDPFALVLPGKEPRFRDWKTAIEDQPFLRYDRASFGGRMVERFLRDERLPVNDAIEVDEIPALIHLVAEGLGVALVPLVEAHLPLPDDVHVMSLGKSTFYRETGLLQRRVSDSPPVVAHFTQFLKDIAGCHSTKIDPGNTASDGFFRNTPTFTASVSESSAALAAASRGRIQPVDSLQPPCPLRAMKDRPSFTIERPEAEADSTSDWSPPWPRKRKNSHTDCWPAKGARHDKVLAPLHDCPKGTLFRNVRTVLSLF